MLCALPLSPFQVLQDGNQSDVDLHVVQLQNEVKTDHIFFPKKNGIFLITPFPLVSHIELIVNRKFCACHILKLKLVEE
jgi:hypothetical protein